MSVEARDRRRDPRRECSRSIWWRGPSDSLYQQGWLVDESHKGLAFLARGEELPRPGEQVRTAAVDGGEDLAAPRGVVRRVREIQSNVALIAVELFPAGEAVVRVAAAERVEKVA